MAGYSRQSAADIIANAVIKAAPVNAEYNALRDAFALATGHKHDGSSTEGGYVPLIADSDALNKVVIDTSNNRIGFFTEVSSSAVEQLRIQDGAIVPVTDNDIDLGTSSLEFKDLYIDGVGYLDSVDIDGGSIDGVTIGGSSAGAGTFSSLVATTADINAGTIDNTVIGGTTAAAADFTTMDASGNATVGGTLGVTGNVTMGGTLAVTGTTALTGTATITSADINSGSMDNTTIGNTTAAAGTFTNLTSTGTSTHATVDINGGAIDGVTIGAASAGAGTFTDLTASGTTTITTADINGGNIDGTVIGSSSAAAGSFTTVSTSGQATLATADINGGTIDNAVIGGSTAAAITGTTITGTSLVGAVTGNVTGNVTGDVTGDVTGNLTGNVTASSGSSTFNNVTVNGTLDVTGTTIANVTDPTSAQDAATKNYVDTEVAALVDSAPGTLDTLNELAAALGDDPNFSTTITNSIATKLPLAGGTMSGAIAMGTNKITGLGDPTANQDAVTKAFADSNYLALSGGTMTGAIDMGSAKITTTYTPTNNADLTTKTYVDGILGSATAAATSATAAASSATAAASSATAAASSATSASSSATSAAASYDSFDDRYLGAKSSAPTVDNDGDALITGALYFNSTTNIMNVYGSSGWQAAGSSVNGTSSRNTYTATAGQTTFSATYDAGFVDVYLNGVKLIAGTDFTATNGTSVVLTTGAAVNDTVDIVAYGTFTLATHLALTGGTLTGGLTGTTATFTTADNSTQLTLVSTDADASVGPVLDLYRNSASPADNDVTGRIIFSAENDADEKIEYQRIITYMPDVSDGSEDGAFQHYIMKDGTRIQRMEHSPSETVFNQDSADVDFRVESNGNANMLFVDGGNNRVGIGTSSPSSLLTLHGSQPIITLSDPDTGSTSTISGNSGHLILNADSGSDASNNTIDFQVDNDQKMRIDSSGNVMIGTTTAGVSGGGEQLTVDNASGNAGISIRSNGTGNGNIYFSDNTTGTGQYAGNLRYDHNTNAMMFNTNSTERMRIDSSGTVAIGTTDIHAWSGTFDGRLRIGDRGFFGTTSGSNQMGYNWYYDGAYKYIDADTANRYYQNGGNHVWDTAVSGSADGTITWSEKMTILNNGNVGIGTSSPTAKLDVNGVTSILSVEEKVTTDTTTSGTLTFDTQAQAVVYLTANQAANRIINFSNVNSNMAIGESMTFAVLATQGSTPYYLNAYYIDGTAGWSGVLKWQGGAAPTAGNASSIDAYSFTIIKTADATFTVLASVTQYA